MEPSNNEPAFSEKLRNWFAPVFRDADNEKAHLRRLVRAIAKGVLLAGFIPLVHNALAGLWGAVWTLFFGGVATGAVIWLNHRGFVKTAIHLLLLSLLGVATALLFTSSQGFRDVALLIFPSIVMVAAMLVDVASFVLVAALAMLCVNAVILGELSGAFVTSFSSQTSFRDLLDANVVLAVTAFVAGLLARDFRQSLEEVKRHEAAIQESNRELEEQARRLKAYAQEVHDLYNKAPCGYHSLDANGVFVRINETELAWLGYDREEMIGKKKFADLIPPEEWTTFEENFKRLKEGRLDRDLEFTMIRKNGTLLPVLLNATAVVNEAGGFVMSRATIIDLAEKKRAEARMLRAQRLESVGRLASGIAHDLNNILTPILMSVSFLRKEPLSERSCAVLDTVESSVHRGAGIIKQVLTFSRGIGGQKAPLQLERLIKELTQLVRATFPRSVTVEMHVDKNLRMVHGDGMQIYQVLMNLCVNARDAMPQGGHLSVAAENVFLDAEIAATVGQAGPGSYALITVKDNGVGIAPEHMDKIFDPFFTTKADHGTGLGLATVLGIVQGHDGAIQLESRRGEGTEFRVYLPAMEAESSCISNPVVELPRKGNGELILVIEDEELIRMAAEEVLRVGGYRVLSAGRGSDGIDLLAEHRKEVQLVVTDLMMPLMNGVAVIRAVRQINPRIKVLVMSGLGADPLVSEAAALDIEGFLEKPFSASGLLKSVAAALRRQGLNFLVAPGRDLSFVK